MLFRVGSCVEQFGTNGAESARLRLAGLRLGTANGDVSASRPASMDSNKVKPKFTQEGAGNSRQAHQGMAGSKANFSVGAGGKRSSSRGAGSGCRHEHTGRGTRGSGAVPPSSSPSAREMANDGAKKTAEYSSDADDDGFPRWVHLGGSLTPGC